MHLRLFKYYLFDTTENVNGLKKSTSNAILLFSGQYFYLPVSLQLFFKNTFKDRMQHPIECKIYSLVLLLYMLRKTFPRRKKKKKNLKKEKQKNNIYLLTKNLQIKEEEKDCFETLPRMLSVNKIQKPNLLLHWIIIGNSVLLKML